MHIFSIAIFFYVFVSVFLHEGVKEETGRGVSIIVYIRKRDVAGRHTL